MMESQPLDTAGTTIRLHTGERITLSVAQVLRVYDELWLLGRTTKGAIAAAAKLKGVNTWTLLHDEDVLNEDETLAFREAIRRAERG
jgi:hypothetical protein